MLTLLNPWSCTPDVGQVGRHAVHRVRAADLEELLLSRGVELEDGRAELEALRPLGPAPGGPPAVDCEHGRALRGAVGSLGRADLPCREGPERLDLQVEIAGGNGAGEEHSGILPESPRGCPE